jgi:uncharacterized protein YkwD
MRASIELLCAVSMLTACSDGVGMPIQRQAPEQELDRDAASDRDGESAEDEDDGDELDEEHCRDTFAWPASYAASEEALLEAINTVRERSIRCGDREVDGLPPLRLSSALRCAARLHSRDMVLRDFIGSTDRDGEGPRDRMRAAGYRVEEADESLVIGEREAQGALLQLLEDRDDCFNVATWRHADVGIGRYEDRWTLDFASD